MMDLSVIDETVAALSSMTEKVLLRNPSWQELPELLTEDELRVFLAFVDAMERRKKPKESAA